MVTGEREEGRGAGDGERYSKFESYMPISNTRIIVISIRCVYNTNNREREGPLREIENATRCSNLTCRYPIPSIIVISTRCVYNTHKREREKREIPLREMGNATRSSNLTCRYPIPSIIVISIRCVYNTHKREREERDSPPRDG